MIATGFNGLPASINDLPVLLNDAPTKNAMVIHAEQNAIMRAGVAAKGGTVYVSGKPVCSRCAGAIIQSGIRRVVARAPKESTPSKWDKSGMVTKQMFEMASIEFVATG